MSKPLSSETNVELLENFQKDYVPISAESYFEQFDKTYLQPDRFAELEVTLAHYRKRLTNPTVVFETVKKVYHLEVGQDFGRKLPFLKLWMKIDLGFKRKIVPVHFHRHSSYCWAEFYSILQKKNQEEIDRVLFNLANTDGGESYSFIYDIYLLVRLELARLPHILLRLLGIFTILLTVIYQACKFGSYLFAEVFGVAAVTSKAAGRGRFNTNRRKKE